MTRVHDLHAVRYNLDNAFPNFQALHIIETRTLPLLGQPSSIALAHPPLTSYFLVPAMLLTGSPAVSALIIAVLNGLGTVFVYLSARDITQRQALGFIAAALTAFNPWLVEYSRMTWPPALLPFLMPLLAWLLWPVLTGSDANPARRTLIALGALALTMGTFLWAFFLAVPVGLLLLIYRRRTRWSALIGGGALIAVMGGLFALGVVSSGSLSESATRLSSSPAALKTEALSHAARLVTGASYAEARAGNAADAPVRYQLGYAAEALLTLALAGGIISAMIAALRGNFGAIPRDRALIALVMFALPVAALSYTGSPVHPYYMLLTVPSGTVLAVWGIGWLWRGRIAPVVVSAALAAICVLWVSETARFSAATLERPGDWQLTALPLGDAMRLGDGIKTALPANGRVFANAEAWALTSTADRMFTLQRDYQSNPVVAPPDGGLYIRFIGADETPVATLFSTPVSEIALSDGSRIMLETISADVAVDVIRHRLDIPSEDGMTLLGYTLETDTPREGRARLYTFWQVTRADFSANTRAFGTFTHLVRPDGEPIRYIDGTIIPGFDWRDGDIHVHTANFRIPDAAFEIRVGQYDATTARPMIFILPDGTYTGYVTLETP